MAQRTRTICVSVGQRETRRVLEVCTLPAGSVVAFKAVCAEAARDVIGTCDALIIIGVAR